jgi:hypothetical protein
MRESRAGGWGTHRRSGRTAQSRPLRSPPTTTRRRASFGVAVRRSRPPPPRSVKSCSKQPDASSSARFSPPSASAGSSARLASPDMWSPSAAMARRCRPRRPTDARRPGKVRDFGRSPRRPLSARHQRPAGACSTRRGQPPIGATVAKARGQDREGLDERVLIALAPGQRQDGWIGVAHRDRNYAAQDLQDY